MLWRLLDSGCCEAAYNMALDEAIAVSVRRGESPPTLRLYGWNIISVSMAKRRIGIDSSVLGLLPSLRKRSGKATE